jgi:hypothetical protein
VLAAGSFTHSTVRHPFRSAGCTSLLPHFFISFISPASAPRSKSPAFAPLHKSRPIPFLALVIYLANPFHNCISILYSYPLLVICFPAFPANSSNPSIPSIRFVPFQKVIAFPFFPSHNFTNALFSLPYCSPHFLESYAIKIFYMTDEITFFGG